MSKKYQLIRAIKGYDIKALIDIPRHGVKAGDLGGFVTGEHNLSQEGDCWIQEGSSIADNASITGNAIVCNDSVVCDNARISGDAVVKNSVVWGHASVTDNAVVTQCRLREASTVRGNSHIQCLFLKGNCDLHGNTRIILEGFTNLGIRLQGEFTEKDYLFQGPDTLTGNWSLAFKTADGVRVSTASFYGTLDEYLAAVEDTHKDDREHLPQYLRFHANFVKHFSQ